LFSGFVLFGYLGHLALNTGLHVDKVVQAGILKKENSIISEIFPDLHKGHGLAYVIYPFAVSIISGSQFWSVCFFMMILLGVDTMVKIS
jgi:hypothetical protein